MSFIAARLGHGTAPGRRDARGALAVRVATGRTEGPGRVVARAGSVHDGAREPVLPLEAIRRASSTARTSCRAARRGRLASTRVDKSRRSGHVQVRVGVKSLAFTCAHPPGQGWVAMPTGQPPPKRPPECGATAPAVGITVAAEVARVVDELQQRPSHAGKLSAGVRAPGGSACRVVSAYPSRPGSPRWPTRSGLPSSLPTPRIPATVVAARAGFVLWREPRHRRDRTVRSPRDRRGSPPRCPGLESWGWSRAALLPAGSQS